MPTLIVYYSRSGTTKKLADALATALDADTLEIHCSQYDGGLFRYLRAGYDSLKGNLPTIDVPENALVGYDLVLIGTPVWTSHPALPIRAFLSNARQLPEQIGLFLTYGEHSEAEVTFSEMAELLPGTYKASLALSSNVVNGGDLTGAINRFASELGQVSNTATA